MAKDKGLFSRIWFPVAVVAFAAVQSFGGTFSRIGLSLRSLPSDSPVIDTVKYSNEKIFTKFREEGFKIAGDSLALDLGLGEEDTSAVKLSARDTIFAPDSLKDIDPFRYKYYVALLDSLTHKQVRDSLRAAGDSLDWPKLDSLYYADSTIAAKKRFDEWYASLDKNARKKYDFEQKMAAKQRKVDSTLAVKDSLMAIRDSIRENKPRILETFALPDSLQYKRIVSWTRDAYFNEIKTHPIDTSYNYWFNDYPFMRNDVGATYLGIIGSPAQTYDFFKRDYREGVTFYEPYEIYSHSPATLPMYNTKTPYTELAYWGTFFANTESEETNLHILTTQNIFPELNFTLGYDRYGANGLLENERVDNRNFHASVNYIGKKYAAHLGYIYNKVAKNENGGIIDTFWIRDTTVGSREISTFLSDAHNLVKKNTVFLDQTYRIPFTFIKDLAHRKDSTYLAQKQELAESGMIDTDVTTAFIGHSSEFTVIRKVYTDNISSSDTDARAFFNDNFYLNPTSSSDSLRVMKLENKVFLRLQPWSDDAIVSSLNVGVGNRIMSHYMFRPGDYLIKSKNAVWNSTYIYGGVGGQYRQNIDWNAQGYYTILGDQFSDFGVSADALYQFFPFRRARKSPVSLQARFETKLEEPQYYQQHFFSNHFKWENDFGKISTTKIEAKLSIPWWKTEIGGGYALLSNNIYYDTLGVARQNTTAMSVAKLYLAKNFVFGPLHLDNRVLLQWSSNKEAVPLPMGAANLRWYLQIPVVKDVMTLQIGADATATTKWYAPAYNPVLGVFHNQDKEQFGECPYFDAFVNIQWKRASIFIKYVNAGMGWPLDEADYFSAAKYIRPQRAFKFGVSWPFYLQTKKNAQVSASGPIGGGSSSSRSGGGSSLSNMAGSLRSR
ncbi:MAG: putative porin [Bacteroidales bacterium]|nr:putative porin [Bacteroidales bacterium]